MKLYDITKTAALAMGAVFWFVVLVIGIPHGVYTVFKWVFSRL